MVRSRRALGLWRAARLVALLALGIVLALLVIAPTRGLALVWGGAIPLVAVSLFVTPMAWRGVCPLATLNEIGNRFRTAPPPSPALQHGLGVAGLILFHVLVPARLLWFNHDGGAAMGATVAIALVAVGLGAAFAVRSAFCNGLCPILPIERLYGQAPLVAIERARCDACTVCTPRGCLDLAGTRSLPQILGPARRSTDWLLSPFGVFAATLPGLIAGYFLAPAEPAGVIDAYQYTLFGSLLSYLLTAALALVARRPAAPVLAVLAAVSGAIYFGFTGPAIARLWHLPAAIGVGFSVTLVSFVAWWLSRALPLSAVRSR